MRIVNSSTGIGRIIPDEDKRFAIREFVNTYSGFPERCMLTNEYAWPLRPEIKSSESAQSSIRMKELQSVSEYEQDSADVTEHPSRKRGAPWCATDTTIVKKRRELEQRAARTADREARGVVKRSASCDSKHAAFHSHYISMLDDECAVA